MLVVGLRLVVPLFIPRFPLPAILAALVIDGVDKSIFAAFTATATSTRSRSRRMPLARRVMSPWR